MNKVINVNGVDYVPASEARSMPAGNRVVLVVDRGWVFAGDAVREDGKVTLYRAMVVRRWSGCGFNGMITNPKSDNVVIEMMPVPVVVPSGSILFEVPVADDWGL